jgi:PIN domain nuclease of toxin-antitoxin system
VARQSIDAAQKDNGLAVSAISFWEIAMLVAKGRIVMDIPLSAWRQDLLNLGLVEIPVDGEVGIAAVQFEDLHNDPADRIIIATALLQRAVLVTADHRILEWPGKLDRLDARR